MAKRIYRTIYENHFGPIPKDSDGRSYEIHHIDGNNKNDDLKNLRLLCPNCHSQTDTWCGKNVKVMG